MQTVKAVPERRGVVAATIIGRLELRRSCSSVEREADEAAPVRGHEVDGLGRDLLGGDAEVALVLAVLVVDEDDHLTVRNRRSPLR